MTKTCSKCKIEKDLSTFSKSKRGKGGYRAECKDCEKLYRKINSKRRQEYKKSYYEDNKTQIKEYQKNNQEEIRKYKQEWCKKNTEKSKIHRRAYLNDRYKSDPLFRLHRIVSKATYESLRKIDSSKNNQSVLKFLPFESWAKLKNHIEKQFEPWMTWDNQGKYDPKTWNDNDQSTWTWQLDHIIPQSRFKYSSMNDEEFRKCWALDNLRPYPSKHNVTEKDRR